MSPKKKAKVEQQPAVEPDNPAHGPDKSPEEKAEALTEQIEEMHREQDPDSA